jgi:tetratricopeptide (TPR) repeat protein
VGTIGDNLRMDYTALGDTANLASRMESNAEPGTVLVSEETYRLARDYFLFESLGEIRVKGKTGPVAVYRPLGRSEVETRIEAAAAKGLTRFVGRSREMQALRYAYDKAASGAGQAVGVVGDAGVGKSRLLLEFRNSLEESQCLHLEGQCLHYGGSIPYLPILDVLRSFLGLKEGEPESSIKDKMESKILDMDERLKTVIGPFQDLLSLIVDDEDYIHLEPGQKKTRAFEAVKDLLICTSRDRPLVLAIEDLQWIDRTSEELIDYMIGWLPNTPILMIILYRPEYTHQWESKSYFSRIGLDQLSGNASAELMQAILEDGNVDPELRDLILNRTSGNPLFIEEMTQTLLENGSIQMKDTRYTLVGNHFDTNVPATIHGVIAARMDRLDDTLKRLLQVASVIGREFLFRVLSGITGMQKNLKTHLLNLQGLEFIYEKALFPELEYIFKHALTQEVAYKSLLQRRRMEIHEKIGKAMEEIFPDRLEEFYEVLAYHYGKSKNKEKAYEYRKLSGDKAARRSSILEAFQFYKEALKVLKELPDEDEIRKKRLSVIVAMAAPLRMLGYPEDSYKILEEGERLSNDLHDTRINTSLRSLIGMYHSTMGKPFAAVEYQEKAFIQAQDIQDPELIIQIGYDLCSCYFILRKWHELTYLSKQALSVIEETGRLSDYWGRPAHPYSAFLMFHGVGQAFMGEFEEGKRFLDKALSVAPDTGEILTKGTINMAYAYFFQFKGDADRCIHHTQEATKVYKQAKVMIWLAQMRSILGYAEYLRGNLGAALNQIEKALKIQQEVGTIVWKPSYYLYAGMIHLELGDQDQATENIQTALSLAEEGGERELEGLSKIEMGRILGKSGESQLEKAEQWFLQGISILKETEGKPQVAIGYFRLGELFADLSYKDKALENLIKAKSMFLEMGMDYWLDKTREVLTTL